MPATSTNFEFTVNSETTAQVAHPDDSSVQTFTSDKLKGDGYYRGGDGSHTVEFKLSDYIGKIKIQGSLAETPGNTDWFDVSLTTNTSALTIDTTGAVQQNTETELAFTNGTTSTRMYNFSGNLVWVRAVLSNFTQGTVNYVRMNY